MIRFYLKTEWKIPFPLQITWDAIMQTEEWPRWWKYVKKVEVLEPGEASGLNSVTRFHWTTRLPYRLTLDLKLTRIETRRLLETAVTGDLTGRGRCVLTAQPDYTAVLFIWEVSPCRSWMNFFSPVARTAFEWNHRQVMLEGEKSLIRRLSSGR
ncbi:MAG: SRPBCC family protein [Gammaproteobacteria bacterium]